MEFLLAMSAAVAVILFGALISIGNERQRRAIDCVSEHLQAWALRDLQIKRKGLENNLKVDDPLGWLETICTRVLGSVVRLKVHEYFEDPAVLVCEDQETSTWLAISPVSPGDVKQRASGSVSRMLHVSSNPLSFPVGRRQKVFEISPLNAGLFFDLEMQIAWQALTGRNLKHPERMWIYRISPYTSLH